MEFKAKRFNFGKFKSEGHRKKHGMVTLDVGNRMSTCWNTGKPREPIAVELIAGRSFRMFTDC